MAQSKAERLRGDIETQLDALYADYGRRHEYARALKAAALYLIGETEASTAGDDLDGARRALDEATADTRIVAILTIADGGRSIVRERRR